MGSHLPPSHGAAVMGMRLGMLPSLGFINVMIIIILFVFVLLIQYFVQLLLQCVPLGLGSLQ